MMRMLYNIIITDFENKLLEPVFTRSVCGLSSIILLTARRKSESILTYGELF